MALFCPKPCGHLATAAVFIAVGVVQLLVGVILLRSNYAELLSGADFLTSATNILVGCLYGISASVWQSTTKRITAKRTARKNTLAALLVSVITVNTTAVIVLLMSEGNQLLSLPYSLPYFNDPSGHSSVTFAKEVFASAYVASVCSPIVCLVVALVALSGNCFQTYKTQNHPNQDSSVEKIENPFGWVFEEKTHSGPKVISDIVKASSESSPSENSVFSANGDSSCKRKSILPVENVASPLHTWRQKRARILKNDSLSRKNLPFDARSQNANYMDGLQEGLIPRIKNFSMIKYQMKNGAINGDVSKLEGNGRSSKENKMSNTGFYHSSDNTDLKKVRSDSYTTAILEGNRVNYETKFKRKCVSMVNKAVNAAADASSEQKYCDKGKSPEHFRSVHCSVDETLAKISYVSVHKSPLGISDVQLGELTEVEDPEITRLKLMTLQELKKRIRKSLPGSKVTVIRCRKDDDFEVQHKEQLDFKSSMHNQREIPEGSSHSNENLSPGEVFEPGTDYNAEIEYPHRKEHLSISRSSSPFYAKPLDLSTSKKINTEMKEIRGILRPKSIIHSSSVIVTTNQFQASGGDVHSYDERKIGKPEQDCPNVASSKLQNKKREISRKIASMASIAEVPSEEGVGLDRGSSPLCSRRTTSLDESSKEMDENSNIMIHSSPSRRFSKNSTLMKSRSFSPKGLLKKIWSSSPETKLSVSDLIVDEDSLIGLSDEELLTRTLRIRSLRKVVAERLRKENEMKTKMEDAQATE